MLDWTEIYIGSTLFFSQTQTPQTHMVAISKVGWFVDEWFNISCGPVLECTVLISKVCYTLVEDTNKAVPQTCSSHPTLCAFPL